MLLIGIVGLAGCKKDEVTNWQTELLLPIAQSTLTLQDLVDDESLVEGDSLLHISFNSTLYNFNLADQVLDIPDTFIGTRFSLDSINWPQQRLVESITLGAFAREMQLSSDPAVALLGGLLLSGHGTTSVIPGFNNLTVPPEVFDAQGFFEEADLSRGFIDLSITNEFPIPFTNVQFQLKDNVSGVVLASTTIDTIHPFGSAWRRFNVSGQTVHNSFQFEVLNIETPGSGSNVVPIDTTDFLEVRIRIWGLSANRIIAQFPTIDVVSVTEEITQDLGDVQLTYIDAKRGDLRIFITSSVDEALNMTYVLEGAYDKNGNPLVVTKRIPAAPPGGTSTIDESFDLTGYSISLTGSDGTKFNTYTQTVSATIDSSGITRTITSDDSLQIRYELNNIFPNYMKGYIGQHQIAIGPETTSFSLDNILNDADVEFEAVDMNLIIRNELGVNGTIKINDLDATNDATTIGLTSSQFAQPITIDAASDFPLTSAITTVPLNSSNSNITDVINLKPDQFTYELDIDINPNGNDLRYQDFAYFDNGLQIDLEVDVPLSVTASSLVLTDTVDFTLGSSLDDIDALESGTLNLIAYNGYPFRGITQAIVLDDNGSILDTLLFDDLIEAGLLDANCKVNEAARTKLAIDLDSDRVDKIRNAKRAILKVDFSTYSSNATCNGQYLKLYKDYQIELKLTGKFNYTFTGDL